MEEERREKIRIKKELVVRYCYNDKNKRVWDESCVRDISEKGMMFTTIRNFQPDEVVHILIKIPFEPFRWLEFEGKVVGSEELKTALSGSVAGTYITRVEFINLKEEQKTTMQLYVEWFLSQKGGESQ